MASHEGRRAVAAWKVARYERKITTSIAAALAVHHAKVNSSGARPGTAPPDPFDLATWSDTVHDKVHPVVHSVLSEIVGDVAKAAGLAAGIHLLGRSIAATGQTVAQAVDEAADGIVQQASAVGEKLAPRVVLAISTADDSSKLAASMNTLFNLADVNASLVARSANFFSNALATQAALTIHDENPMQKTWTTMGDDRVRPDHDDVDGVTMPADEPFDVGGDSLMYPGDPNGSEAEVANCRCWLVFEPLESEAAAEPEPEEPEEDSLAAALATTTLRLADAQGLSVEQAEDQINKAMTRLVDRGHTSPVRSDFRLPNRAQRRAAARQARSKR